MSQALSHFLSEDEGALTQFIRRAEKLCGYPSEDIRLITDTSNQVRGKIVQLGLDPADTTDEELYYALRSKAEKDSQLFSKQYGRAHTKNLFEYCERDEKVLALKKVSAKRILAAAPPKQLMKKLNYRSVDSMLKRQDPTAILALSYQMESGLWKQKFARQLKKILPSDFQEQDTSLVYLSENLSKLANRMVEPAFLTGSVVVAKSKAARVNELDLMLRLLEEAEKLRNWSQQIRDKQLSPNFAKFVAEHATSEPGSQIGGLSVCFYKVQKNYRSPIEKLAALNLPLSWWRENNHLGKAGIDKPISLSLRDLLGDDSKARLFADRQTSGFGQALWHKLLETYIRHPAFAAEISKQLDPEPVLADGDALPGKLEHSLSGAI